jgi:putative flavoprotein involved in K+ transport
MKLTPIHAKEIAERGEVEIEQTRARAGEWLEQGAAFGKLQAAVQARTNPTVARRPETAPDDGERRFDVIVIGAGQAGLSVGYFLQRMGVRFILLEAGERIGDSWRKRWDSLRLFTPARYDALVGMRFPAAPFSFPSKDEMADYLETYATRFALPVTTGVRVDEVTRVDGLYVVKAGAARYVAEHVVVAAASYQQPKIPSVAKMLDPDTKQLHSLAYERPEQLKPGAVLLVGAGNSGAELALDLAKTHKVWLAGRHPGHIPFVYNSFLTVRFVIPLLFRGIFHRLLSVDTPVGRKAKPKLLSHGGPLIRVKPKDLDDAGIRRVARLAGASEGRPLLEDGTILDVDNVIWCTGFRPGLDWIKLPIFDAAGRPQQYRGIVEGEPGLYVCGLPFQHSQSSTMVHGVSRDARLVAEKIAQRMRAAARRS